jgi:hypothetical protein
MDWLDRVKEEKEKINREIEEFKIFYEYVQQDFINCTSTSVHRMFLLSEALSAMKRYESALEEIIEYEENKE